MHAKVLAATLGLAAILVVAGAGLADVTIETVPVGNPDNADDTHGDGYGGVDYVYNIGMYEVTAGQYTEFLNAVAATDTYGLYNMDMDNDEYGCQITRNADSGSYTYDFGGGTVEAPGSTASDWADRPVNYVSWGDAARFANWLHNGQPAGAQDMSSTEDGSYYLNGAATNEELLSVMREADATWVIPTEDEWYKAAYHKNDGVTGNYFDYPTSSDTAPSNDLVDPDPGNNANFYQDATWPDPNGFTIGSPYYRTDRGEFEYSEGPYGTLDQGGNVWEWNETSPQAHWRGARGSSFNNDEPRLHAAYEGGDSPTCEFYDTGFRVSQVPEPAALSVLVLGGLALTRRRGPSSDHRRAT